MDRVPATFDLLRVAGFLDKDDAGKTVVKIPEIYTTNSALKITRIEKKEGTKSRTSIVVCTCVYRLN